MTEELVNWQDIEKTIRQMSIRGRFALGTVCLEKYILNQGLMTNKAERFLDFIWTFTDSDSLLDWEEEAGEIFPEGVRDIPAFIGEFEIVSIHSEFLFNLIECLYEIGTESILKMNLTEHDEATLQPTLQMLRAIHSLRIALPDFSLFEDHSFKAMNGWGFRFKKEDLDFRSYLKR
jgi:hypothetical protein